MTFPVLMVLEVPFLLIYLMFPSADLLMLVILAIGFLPNVYIHVKIEKTLFKLKEEGSHKTTQNDKIYARQLAVIIEISGSIWSDEKELCF